MSDSQTKREAFRAELWDLQAHLEGQLRSVARMHRAVDDSTRHPGVWSDIAKDLTDFLEVSGAIRAVAATALAKSKTLAGDGGT